MESMQRKLVAIMFTDVVNSSERMHLDEAQTLALLTDHDRLLRTMFSAHNGREINKIGDGFLVEFPSAVEGARCAIEIQETLAKRNVDEPAEARLLLRIGLHVGDVVCQGNDIQGDGVNVAKRLESLADPGGICISNSVAEMIRHKIPNTLHEVGKRALKNIQVMQVYRIALG